VKGIAKIHFFGEWFGAAGYNKAVPTDVEVGPWEGTFPEAVFSGKIFVGN
jgi:hypothetical protein